MSPIVVTTASGREYWLDLDHLFWRRSSDPIERLVDLQVGTRLVWPWQDPESWTAADRPEIGKHLYIASREVWYVTTTVVGIREDT